MKNLLLIILTLFLFSCENTPTQVKNPEKETTMEILQLANQDTTCVKVVEIDNIVYVINNGLVTHKIVNSSGGAKTLILIAFIIVIVLIVIALD
jgi:hypothetical protein